MKWMVKKHGTETERCRLRLVFQNLDRLCNDPGTSISYAARVDPLYSASIKGLILRCLYKLCTNALQDLCNSIQKRWPGSAHNSLEVSWQDSWDLRATRALPFQDLYARSDWPWKMSTAPQRERSDRPRVTRGRSHNSHFVWKFTGKMPDAKYTTSIEHQALTLTLRTPQCGHTVWGMKWEHFIVTLWHCFSFSRMIFCLCFPHM